MTDDFEVERVRGVAEDVLEKEWIYRDTLRLLLDWQIERENRAIALPARMGASKSYLITASLGWIAANVYFSRDLPIFKEHIRADSNAIDINDTTAVYLQQRAPDFSRQLPMMMYLATREYHKFPPLLLVSYQDWVYDERHDNWGIDGRALMDSLFVESLDSKSCLIDLDVARTSYFALDGQHRLMAIKGLKGLLDNGRISPMKKDGSLIFGKEITREKIEQFLIKRNLDPNWLLGAMNEVMGVEIIPAVQDRETFGEAVSRIRNVFVDVNENAKRLERGELALLEENDGFRIVARTVMIKHRLFKGDSGLSVNVNIKNNQISERSENYTTLNVLVSITEEYLGTRPEFMHWKDSFLGLKVGRSACMFRPNDDEIGKGLEAMVAYFDSLAELPSHRQMIAHFNGVAGQYGKSPSAQRTGNQQNIFFRPIAQVALARAVAKLESEQDLDLPELVRMLSQREVCGDFHLTDRKNPWFGILCDPIEEKVRRQKKYEDLCVEMLVYLLGGGFVGDTRRQERLRDNFFEARRGATTSNEPTAWSLSGFLETKDKFRLPVPWQ